ncbi:hypothetical protein IM792_05275 [Mucilaginibacter sp. JRF]|uniref:hypothetical protein n=1 Tax=Mucilaginibacter sp. JRF TaxID=2780088 RepID=UPI0018823463|nr:hypothetical protein [Mucilaginibacter sp. JRF]MBE9583850.1 hypothetical protein [Mucilaginibacter sp. JRF]
MKDFDHIMSVWQDQPKRDQLSVDEALKQVKRGVGSLNNRLLRGIFSMLIGSVAVLIVMLFLVFQSWVTYCGIGIILCTMLLYMFVMIKDYRLVSKEDVTIHPVGYLQGLKEYQHRRSNLYGWLYYLYLLLITIGLSLYLFEVLEHSSQLFRFSFYGFTIVWLLYVAFYLKDRIFKMEQEKLNLIIERLERLQNQFD